MSLSSVLGPGGVTVFNSTATDPPGSHRRLRDSGEVMDLVTDGEFDSDDFAVQVAAYVMSIMGLMVACLCWFSMLPTVRMVSVYDVMQSLLEMINILLLLISIAMMCFSTVLMKLSLFIEGKTTADDDGTSSVGMVTVFTCVLIYGTGCVIITFLGIIAAYKESKRLLLLNAASLSCGLLVGSLSVALLANLDYRGIIMGDCENILKFITSDFYDTISCVKYDGYSETWDPSASPPDWVAGTGAGESTQCDEKIMTVYAWEFSPGAGRVGDVSYWGCLNTACCPALATFMETYEWIAVLFVALVIAACFCGIIAALYLRRETTADQDTILVHPWSKFIGVGMVISVFAMCIVLALIVNTGEWGDITQEEVETKTNMASTISVQPKRVKRASCFNRVIDGFETDIDCGGTCASKCGASFGCNNATTDCEDGLICTPISAVSETCFDKRCLDGQTERASGICEEVSPAITCANGVQDRLETCVDGGGAECLVIGTRCGEATSCNSTEDCQMGLFCSSSLACYNCSNTLLDGDETSADCGGPECGPCQDGSACTSGADCASASCIGALCVSCFNGVRDGNESCTDGGGNCADLCAVPASCGSDADCATGYCNVTESVSVCRYETPSDTCNNGVQSGSETCLDGGGVQCRTIDKLCNETQGCEASIDCFSAACFNGTCFSCNNTVADGDESDVDCGGSICAPCGDNATCADPSSCGSGMCTNGRCTSYYNDVQDGVETDVDCGGPAPSKCPIGSSCSENSDCETQLCDATVKVCREETREEICSDGGRGAAESDIDCGGLCTSIGLKCGDGRECTTDNDCQSTLCALGTCVSCTDQIQTGEETDQDCGGPGCQPCADGRRCVVGTDCASTDCYSGAADRTCVSCSNGVVDGSETDVDCGGLCQQRCDLAQHCVTGSDCGTRYCDSVTTKTNEATFTCRAETAAESCQNKIQDELESDVDCGGPVCSTLTWLNYTGAENVSSTPFLCNDGLRCTADGDCKSRNCHDNVCVSCSNAMIDGAESDVDCGGPTCSKCVDGSACSSAQDCAPSVCNASVCNRAESPHPTLVIDCPICNSTDCALDAACGSCYFTICSSQPACPGNATLTDIGADFTFSNSSNSPVARPPSLFEASAPPQCDGTTTRAFCCGAAPLCLSDSNCLGGQICDAGLCRRQTEVEKCNNGHQDPGETDVDCGGSSCASVGNACPDGSTCQSASDCARNSLCVSGVCASCSNGFRDGGETGTDCGGAACEKCTDGAACAQNSDCASLKCFNSSTSTDAPVCVSCFNELQDGDEADVDCGGSCARLCDVGSSCTDDSYCTTGHCSVHTYDAANSYCLQQNLSPSPSPAACRMSRPSRV